MSKCRGFVVDFRFVVDFVVQLVIQQIDNKSNYKHWDSAYLRQGTSYQCRDTIRDPDRQQNLIIFSLAHCQPSLTISCKSVRKFLRKVANGQTATQTTRLHILLDGGNKWSLTLTVCQER